MPATSSSRESECRKNRRSFQSGKKLLDIYVVGYFFPRGKMQCLCLFVQSIYLTLAIFFIGKCEVVVRKNAQLFQLEMT